MSETPATYKITEDLELIPLRNGPRDLISEWFEYTPVGLRELRPGQAPPLEAYMLAGADLKTEYDLARLRTGDLLVSIENHYPTGDMADRLAVMWGFEQETVVEWKRVCREVPEYVRVAGLTYSHYRALTVLAGQPEAQKWWGEWALEGDGKKRWPSAYLRQELCRETGQEAPDAPMPGHRGDLADQLTQENYRLEIELQEAREQVKQYRTQLEEYTGSMPAGAVARGQVKAIIDDMRGFEVDPYRLKTDPDREAGRIRAKVSQWRQDLEELES